MNERDLQRHVRAIREQIEGDLEERHPDLELELFPYAAGSLRDEAIEAHLQTCVRCADDVRDLRPVRRRSPVPYLAAAAAVAAMAITALLLMREPSPRSAVEIPRPPAVVRVPAAAPDEWAPLLRAARAGEMPSMPAVLRQMTQEGESLRGGSTAAESHAPAGVVVETQQPHFTWSANADERSVVSIFAGSEEVMRSGTIRGGRWTPQRPLRRGVTYSWEVRIETGDSARIVPSPPSPPASFHVLGADAHAELERARATRGNDHLLLALLYARAGLINAALEETERVSDADRGVAEQLREVLTSWRN
ncbi:MAG TPA: hypothetical protein VKB93_27475 [Thermoanaerobaculia bacterium]|nr:hypothetical protein [Thermoanaerobaculia bacterium]